MSLRPAVEPESVLDNRQRTRYSRQILLHGEDGQARLAAARVLVVGAGGLGSPALMYLAAAGVGTIGIVDDDVVDLSNLHRQVIHDSTAIAMPKAVSAAMKIEALNPDVDVIVYPERLTEENAAQLMFGYDVVLDGSDNFFTRYAVDAACSELSIPEVWGSILRYSAQISVFWTGGRARQFGVKEPGVCLRDLFPSPPPPRGDVELRRGRRDWKFVRPGRLDHGGRGRQAHNRRRQTSSGNRAGARRPEQPI
ncbi:ThiF family protein [Actinomyces sp. oral taxon 848 str. F0332]|nr:ThiF family protein [Actinomyces sp. oral taxon 848 str. F0332]